MTDKEKKMKCEICKCEITENNLGSFAIWGDESGDYETNICKKCTEKQREIQKAICPICNKLWYPIGIKMQENITPLICNDCYKD